MHNQHEHAHDSCVHCLHHCSVCNVCYCCKCGKNWGNWYYYYPSYVYTTLHGTISGYTGNLTLTSFCNHLHGSE